MRERPGGPSRRGGGHGPSSPEPLLPKRCQVLAAPGQGGRAHTQPSAAAGPSFWVLCVPSPPCQAPWPLCQGPGHPSPLGTEVSPDGRGRATPGVALMAGPEQMSSAHRHQAGSGSRWHLEPARLQWGLVCSAAGSAPPPHPTWGRGGAFHSCSSGSVAAGSGLPIGNQRLGTLQGPAGFDWKPQKGAGCGQQAEGTEPARRTEARSAPGALAPAKAPGFSGVAWGPWGPVALCCHRASGWQPEPGSAWCPAGAAWPCCRAGRQLSPGRCPQPTGW